MPNQAARNIAPLLAPLVISFPGGRFTATAVCDCNETTSWSCPNMPAPDMVARKIRDRGWDINLAKRTQTCPSCITRKREERRIKHGAVCSPPPPVSLPLAPPPAPPPPVEAPPERKLIVPTSFADPGLSLQEQVAILIKELPGISTREIFQFFPGKTVNQVSGLVSLVYAQGNYRREHMPRDANGRRTGMRYWYERGALPEIEVRAKPNRSQVQFAGRVTDPPYVSPTLEEKPVSNLPVHLQTKPRLLAGTAGMIVQPEETPMIDKPAPTPTDTARAAKRHAYELLLDNYDTGKKRYKGDWSDQVIAEKTGFAIAAVAKLREDDFGPAGPPPQLLNMKESLDRLDRRVATAEGKLIQEMDELSTLQGLAKTLRGDLDRLVQVHGWEA